MYPYCEIIRPTICLLTVLALLVGAIVAGAMVPLLVVALLASFLICGGGNVINDYFDLKIDKINKPKRPIPSGRISEQNALIYFVLLVVIGAGLAALVSIPFLAIALLNIAVVFVYSWKLKSLPIVGNLSVAYLASSSFLAAGLIVGGVSSLLNSAVFVLAIVSFLGTFSREIIKDIEDMKGDQKAGGKTLPIITGKGFAKIVAYLLLLLACFSLVWPYRLLSIWYLTGALPGILLCLVALLKHNKPEKSQKIIKMAMYTIMIGFILGAVF